MTETIKGIFGEWLASVADFVSDDRAETLGAIMAAVPAEHPSQRLLARGIFCEGCGAVFTLRDCCWWVDEHGSASPICPKCDSPALQVMPEGGMLQ